MRWSQSRVKPAPGWIEPCIPTLATKAPAGALWIHEIKHDGYRLLVRKRGDRVTIYTRRGADWTKRFPVIAQTAAKIKAESFVIDGEGVVAGDDGVAVFDRLHSQGHDGAVFLYAFDLLELIGVDLRRETLEARKKRLRALLRGRKSGIVYNEHIEGDGAIIFQHACKMGLEGIVSKRRDLWYRSGKCKTWLKVKNPMSPAALRIEDGTT